MILQQNKFYLYHHLVPHTNVVFYVGVGAASRPFEARKSSRNNDWYEQYEKTGIQVMIIKEFNDLKNAYKAEIEEIEKVVEAGHPLVNTTKGGRGMLGVKPWNCGKTDVFSTTALEKISKASKRCYNTKEKRENHAKKCGSIREFAMYKDEVTVWSGYSQSECAKKHNLLQGGISNVLRKRHKTHKEYTFKYLSEEEKKDD